MLGYNAIYTEMLYLPLHFNSMHPSMYVYMSIYKLFLASFSLSLFHILVTCNPCSFPLALCISLHPIALACTVNIPPTPAFPDLWGQKYQHRVQHQDLVLSATTF